MLARRSEVRAGRAAFGNAASETLHHVAARERLHIGRRCGRLNEAALRTDASSRRTP